jgi:hypothetical protein
VKLSYDQLTAVKMMEREARILRILAESPEVLLEDLLEQHKRLKTWVDYALQQLLK